jgi:hypothetical protein
MQVGNLGLTIYLVAFLKMGAVGSAVSTYTVLLVGEPLLLLPLGLRLSGVSFMRWMQQTLIPGFLPGLAGAGVWLACGAIVKPAGWISLIGCGFFGAVVYMMVLLFFALQPCDRKDLKSAMKSVQSFIPKRFRPAALEIIPEASE